MNERDKNRMRTKLLISIFLILGLSLSITMYQISSFQKKELLSNAYKEAESMASTLRTVLEYQMINKSPNILQRTLEETVKNKQFSKICIIGKNGKINYSSETEEVGRTVEISDKRCSVCHEGNSNVRPSTPTILLNENDKNPFLRTISPIWNKKECLGCHSRNKKILGIFLTEKPVAQSFFIIKTIEKRILLSGVISGIFIFILIYFLIENLLNKKIKKLIEGTKEIGKGNYSINIKIRGNDELKDLAESFNSMAQNIKKNIDEIRSISTQLNILYSIVNRLSKTINLNELKGIIVDLVYEILDTSSTILITKTNDEKLFDVLIKSDKAKKPKNLQYHLDNDSVPQPAILTESHFDTLNKQKPSDLFFSEKKYIAYMPIGMREMKLGMLIAARNNRIFTPDEEELIKAIRTHASIAFENAYLYSVAITDELTGLFTLRHFHTRLEEQIGTFNRYGQKFSLLMLDIDDFKNVNDTYGHPAGDSVLIQAAKIIKQSIRDVDLAFRYGGEEFTVILPETGKNAAKVVAERIRRNIADAEFELDDYPSISVTVSIGASACPSDGTTMKDIVLASDKALYKAKNEGKNRVVLFQK
ncbi:MAG: sensor domain-containing diguanylate cyclase [Candidatus Schekmanbacteria bacterium]|nr:MAG: sensor domain-containing diguanylate cyclase [Candidatus Schekmanbacteria bacterium]